MATKKQRIIGNQQGVAIVYAVMVLLVMSLLGVAVFTLFAANLKATQHQNESIQSHYVAIAGAELAYGALLQDDRSLLNSHFNKGASVTIEPLTDNVVLPNGEVDIEITSEIRNELRYVIIKSIGRANGTNVSKTVVMRFRVTVPELPTWDLR
ncbi:MAG: hypothetical protein GX845_06050 [Erysipelothrix sp.]|nr:hypothetical protein [Erysipelothrix sp.]